MSVITRLFASLALLVLIAFCAFAFLTSFEPAGYESLRAGYLAAGLAGLAAVVYLVGGGGQRRTPAMDD